MCKALYLHDFSESSRQPWRAGTALTPSYPAGEQRGSTLPQTAQLLYDDSPRLSYPTIHFLCAGVMCLCACVGCDRERERGKSYLVPSFKKPLKFIC